MVLVTIEYAYILIISVDIQTCKSDCAQAALRVKFAFDLKLYICIQEAWMNE